MSPRLPGRWLLAIGRVLFDRAVYESAIVPAIADLQAEWQAATSARDRLIARWRGLVAFVSLVVVSPVAFRGWPGRDRGDGAPIVTLVLMTAVGLAVWMWPVQIAGPIISAIAGHHVAVYSRFAWICVLLAPMIVGLYLLWRRHLDAGSDDASLAVAMLVLTSMTGVAALSAAGAVAVFSEIGSRGSAGFTVVMTGVKEATLPVVFTIAAATVSLVVLAWAGSRSRAHHLTPPPVLGRTSAMVLSILGAAVLVGLDAVLRLHYDQMSALFDLLTPVRGPGAGSQSLAARSEVMLYLLLVAVFVTLGVWMVAIATWRALRDRTAPAWFIRVSRAALFVAILGGAWHTTVAYRDMRALLDLEARVLAQRSQPPASDRR